MNIVKINNLIQPTGNADYKGLRLENIVSGSQLYPTNENTAYIFYNEEVVQHEDLEIITQTIYDSKKLEIEQAQSLIITPEKRLEILEQTLAEILGV